MHPTNHQDINEILNALSEGLSSLLQDKIVGMYLTGSLTYGDFNRGSSDIDFLVVLTEELSEEELEKVEELHAEVGERFPEWRKRIESSYITKEMLQSNNPPAKPRPYYNAAKMWKLKFGYEWILNLYILQEAGIVILGPEPQVFIKNISIEDVRDASKKNLRSEWEPILNSPTPFETPDYDKSHLQAYAILSMCRILYTAHNAKVVSKKVAAEWAQQKYRKWRDLIMLAESWEHGEKLDVVDDVVAFIRYTMDEVDPGR